MPGECTGLCLSYLPIYLSRDVFIYFGGSVQVRGGTEVGGESPADSPLSTETHARGGGGGDTQFHNTEIRT